MTPQEISEYAKQQWNAVGDNFFSDLELYSHIYAAQMELALKANCIKLVFTAQTVVDQQEYAKPTNTIKIKRITYDGRPLKAITDRNYYYNSLNTSTTTATGTPDSYFEWADSIFLDPTPAAIGTLKIFSFNQPQAVSVTSTMEVPTRYHLKIADYLLWKLALKDKNFPAAREYRELWQMHLEDALQFERKALRGDSFSSVLDENSSPFSPAGAF